MSDHSYTISWSYDYTGTYPPFSSVEAPYLRASLTGPPDYGGWWFWCRVPEPPWGSGQTIFSGPSGTYQSEPSSVTQGMSLTLSWDDASPTDVTVAIGFGEDAMDSSVVSMNPLSWTFWLDVYNADLEETAISALTMTGDYAASLVWEYDYNGRVVVSASAVTDLRSPRLVRFANGVEMVSRDGAVWRRLSNDHAWASARSATDSAPVLMPGIARTGNAVCLDTAAVQSASAGTGWTSSPPTNVLPTEIAGWPRGATGLRDLLVSEANGKALGATVESGSLKSYLQGQTAATLASLGSATVGGPVVARDTQGRWYVGALVDGTWREWRTGSSWSSWTEQSAQSIGSAAAWSNACLWVGSSGLQLLAGYHKSAGKVRAMWRAGFAGTWSSPADIATVSADVAPYAVQRRDGRWEIGWRTASAWVLYRAASLGGTWTVVT
jgi:hypothetical protein